MASVLLTKSGSAGDQTELLSKGGRGGRGAGAGVLEPDEAASSFLALEEAGAEGEAGCAGSAGGKRGGGGAGRRGGAACACRLAGGCAYGALLALVLLALAAAVLALALEVNRGARCSELSRDVDAMRREMDELKSRAADHDVLRHDVDDLKHRVLEQDIYTKLRAFEDEVYQDEDGAGDDDDEDEDDGDLPPEDESDVDYYPDSEGVEEDEEEDAGAGAAGAHAGAGAATPGPEHRGRFHPQYEHLAHRGGAHGHKKPGTEALNAARAAAEEAAAEAAAATAATATGDKQKAQLQLQPPAAEHAARHKREIGGERPPVLAESYGVAPNASEGLRLYETLVAGGAVATSAPAPGPRANIISPGRSRPWPARRAGKENRDTAAAATRRELVGGAVSARGGGGGRPAPSEVPSVIQRQSRVMQTPTPGPPAPPPRTRALPQPSRQPSRQQYATGRTGEVGPTPADAGRVVRVYQDQAQAPAALRSGAAPRLKKKSASKKTMSSLRDGEEAVGAGAARSSHALRRRPVFAAHYGGDASSYKLGSSSHFEGNGKLRHPRQLFVDWSPASWMSQLNMDKKFNLQDGAVTVTDSGLYFVYAQIHYLDRHDTNGFSVLVNNASALQCTITAGLTAGGAEEPRSNTCFTAGAMYLAPGDQVSVREVGSLRWTLFQPSKSFFGLVKLGHTALIT